MHHYVDRRVREDHGLRVQEVYRVPNQLSLHVAGGSAPPDQALRDLLGAACRAARAGLSDGGDLCRRARDPGLAGMSRSEVSADTAFGCLARLAPFMNICQFPCFAFSPII